MKFISFTQAYGLHLLLIVEKEVHYNKFNENDRNRIEYRKIISNML